MLTAAIKILKILIKKKKKQLREKKKMVCLPFRDGNSDHEGSYASDEVHSPQQTECQKPQLLASLRNEKAVIDIIR